MHFMGDMWSYHWSPLVYEQQKIMAISRKAVRQDVSLCPCSHNSALNALDVGILLRSCPVLGNPRMVFVATKKQRTTQLNHKTQHCLYYQATQNSWCAWHLFRSPSESHGWKPYINYCGHVSASKQPMKLLIRTYQ